MKLVAAALMACALPAFGQGVREQLAAQLHEACVTQTQATLEREVSIRVAQTIDMQNFCTQADAQIQEDRILEYVAARPEAEREPASALMIKLRRGYFQGGLERYGKMMGWPPHAADPDARSPDEIRLALERRKGAIYADYNRALKGNPTLAGQVIVELTVEPSGDVTGVRLRSAELTDAAFLSALKSQIEALRFPAEPVKKLVAKYPIDFLPH